MKKLLTKKKIIDNYTNIKTIHENYENYENYENDESNESNEKDKINYQTIINKLDFQLDEYKNKINTYKNNIDILKNNYKCIVCFDDYIKFIPTCGHAGICINCKNNTRFNEYLNNCIICKKNTKYIEIFLPFSNEKINIDNEENIENTENKEENEIFIENPEICNFNRVDYLNNQVKTIQTNIKILEETNDELYENYELLNNKCNELNRNNSKYVKQNNISRYGCYCIIS